VSPHDPLHTPPSLSRAVPPSYEMYVKDDRRALALEMRKEQRGWSSGCENMPLFGDFICPAVCLYLLTLPSFCLNPMIPRLGARPDFHRNNLYVVSWSSIAVHSRFNDFLNGNRHIRQQIISCGCFDGISAGKLLPYRFRAVSSQIYDILSKDSIAPGSPV
jgi:hypothetical protein